MPFRLKVAYDAVIYSSCAHAPEIRQPCGAGHYQWPLLVVPREAGAPSTP